jgi:hypothetical protein
LKVTARPAINPRPGYAGIGNVANDWVANDWVANDSVANDWKAHPDGEGDLETPSLGGRSDVQRGAKPLYPAAGPQIAAVEDHCARQHGWMPDRSTRFRRQQQPGPTQSAAKTLSARRSSGLMNGPNKRTARIKWKMRAASYGNVPLYRRTETLW